MPEKDMSSGKTKEILSIIEKALKEDESIYLKEVLTIYGWAGTQFSTED